MKPVTSRRGSGAFSLVETALAVALAAFVLTAVLSLMSGGIGGFRAVMDTTICAQIAQRVISDAQQADFRILTGASSGSGTSIITNRRYFDDQGNEILTSALTPAERNRAIYWVNVRVVPRAPLPRSDTKPRELAQVTVEVAANPTGADLQLGTTGQGEGLFKSLPGVRVITYSAWVGRND